MDNEMIERVTYIIMKHNPQTKIGAAIVAVEIFTAMREPTEGMLLGEGVHKSCHMCGGHKEGWQAMIDAAINE